MGVNFERENKAWNNKKQLQEWMPSKHESEQFVYKDCAWSFVFDSSGTKTLNIVKSSRHSKGKGLIPVEEKIPKVFIQSVYLLVEAKDWQLRSRHLPMMKFSAQN